VARNNRVIPWRENPVTLRLIDVAMSAWSEARPAHEVLRIVNAFCVEQGYPTIAERTLRSYRQRAIQLYAESATKSAAERLYEHELHHRHLERKLYEEIDAEKQKPVPDMKAVAILYGHLQRTIAEIPKFDGTTVIHVQQTVEHKSANEQSQILVQVLVQQLGNDAAERFLAEVTRIERGEVVDAESKHIGASATVDQSA
jgi:hypothetical protein